MNKITLTMTPEKCGLLDSLLTAFGANEHLSKEEVLLIFNGNENVAADYLDILSKLNYIQKIGEIEESRLGLVFHKQPGVDLFLSEGGFTGRYNKELKIQEELDSEKKIHLENLILQNESLKHQAKIREQENRIRELDEKIKHFEVLKNYEWLIRISIAVLFAALSWLYANNNS